MHELDEEQDFFISFLYTTSKGSKVPASNLIKRELWIPSLSSRKSSSHVKPFRNTVDNIF
jgi:hypothetical protein